MAKVKKRLLTEEAFEKYSGEIVKAVQGINNLTYMEQAQLAASEANKSKLDAETKAGEASTSATNAAASAEAAKKSAEAAAKIVDVGVDPTLSVEGAAADSKAVGESIGELKKDYGELCTKEIGDNKFDISKILSEKMLSIEDGSTIDSSNYFTTDFIDVSQTDIFSIQSDNSQNGSQRVLCGARCIVFYNENKNVISGVEHTIAEPITKTSNAKYVRLSLPNTILEKRPLIAFTRDLIAYNEYIITSSLNKNVEIDGGSLVEKSIKKEKIFSKNT